MNRQSSRRTLLMAVIVVSLGVGAVPASERLGDCPREGGGLWVLVDAPQGVGTLNDLVALEAILSRMKGQNAWVTLPEDKIFFKLCPHRRPALNGMDFNHRRIATLHRDGVLVEFWSMFWLGDKPGSRDEVTRVDTWAELRFLIVPLLAAKVDLPQSSGVLEESVVAADMLDLLRYFATSKSLHARVALSLGIRYMIGESFDLAHANLCQAALLSNRLEENGSDDHGILGTYELARKLMGLNILAAKADTSYSGALKTLELGSGCVAVE